MKGFICVLLIALLVSPIPARSKPRIEDVSIPASVNGASGMLTFHFDDYGQVQYVSAYAGTSDWSMTGFWSAGGGWSFSPVTLNDPELADPSNGRDTIFARAYEWNGRSPDGDPSPPLTDYPTSSPTTPSGKSCQQCVEGLRADCQATWRAESVGAVVVGGAATAGCTVVTATLGFALCVVGGMAVTGTAVWIARTHFKSCWNAAPLTCSDPATGKQCFQLGY